MAMRFVIVVLGCSVAPSETQNGRVWLNNKCLGGKALDSDHFVMSCHQAGSKSESKHCTFASTSEGWRGTSEGWRGTSEG